MARLTPDNLVRAEALIALYPHKRMALVPALHLLQEQDGYLSADGIEHLAELFDLKAAEVRGTASFYDLFHLEPIGRYLVAVCTNIACMLDGAYELLEHMEDSLGVHPGGTTEDGVFTLEDAECLALCGNAPCLTVNWRFFGDMNPERWDQLADDLRAGRLASEVPPHGTLCRVQRASGLAAVGATVHSQGAPGGEARPAAPAGEARPAAPAGEARPAAPAGEARPAAATSGQLADGRPVTGAQSFDAAGAPVDLRTSRTTSAVASTILPGAGPDGGRATNGANPTAGTGGEG